MVAIKESFDYCQQIMKKHSKSFSYAFDFLPEQQQKAVRVIYSACRIIDDSIDVYENPQMLKDIYDDILLVENASDHDCLEFNSNQHIMAALVHVSKHFQVGYQSFYNLINTVYQDQNFEIFDTDDALFDYCYGVAGTVGELLTPILASTPNDKTYHVARTLSEALQLTNILRDVGEDFENGRIYFSRNHLEDFNVSIEYQYHEGVAHNYIELWEDYATIAENHCESALSHIDVFNKEAQPIVELAAIIYREILNEVRQASYTLHRRVYVSKFNKAKSYKSIKKKYQL